MYHHITWHPFIVSLFCTQVEDTGVQLKSLDVSPDHVVEEPADGQVDERDRDSHIRELHLDTLVELADLSLVWRKPHSSEDSFG